MFKHKKELYIYIYIYIYIKLFLNTLHIKRNLNFGSKCLKGLGLLEKEKRPLTTFKALNR